MTEAQKRPPIDWPHAPPHRFCEAGTFMVTAGTYQKAHHFNSPEKLDILNENLLNIARQYGWQLEAWAIFANHYHFVGFTESDSVSLRPFLKQLHVTTARQINQIDGESGRKVWHNYFETQLTFEKSYYARLNYVHQNPVHHGLVPIASQYKWCSAAWFERTAGDAMVKTIYGFKTDRVNVDDSY